MRLIVRVGPLAVHQVGRRQFWMSGRGWALVYAGSGLVTWERTRTRAGRRWIVRGRADLRAAALLAGLALAVLVLARLDYLLGVD